MSRIDDIKNELESLNQQKDLNDRELQQMESTGITDYGRYNTLRENSAQLGNRIAELAAEAEPIDVSAALSDVYEALESIPIAFLLTTDIYELDKKVEIIATSVVNVLEKQAEVERSLKRQLQTQEEMINELREERDAANAELFDARSKLHNAAEQLDEEKRTSKEKDAEITRLRESLSKASEKAPAPTYEEYKEEHIKALESRPAIYDLQWTDDRKKTHYTAKRVDNGEQLEPFSRLTLGLYRVIEDPAEVERFRQDLAQAEAERLAQEIDEQGIKVPELQFHETDAEVPEHSTDGALDDTPVTRAEFEALAQKVDRLSRATGYPNLMQDGAA